jgi:hypothetical protein
MPLRQSTRHATEESSLANKMANQIGITVSITGWAWAGVLATAIYDVASKRTG